MALNARIKKNWSEAKSEMNMRWRLRGSEAVCFWLAKIIRGSSQHVRTRRGVERESVAINRLREDHPVSERFFNQERLIREMQKLYIKLMGQSQLRLSNQAVGISMSVGIRIFSIGGGLGFVVGRSREFEQWLLVGRDQRLLRRLRMQGGAWGMLRSWLSLVGGFIRRGQ